MNRILGMYKLLGVIFLALLLLGVYLTYAVFTKQFTAYDRVTLKTSSIGLQLPARADVKIRGVIVGEVLDTKADVDGAELTLGLYPDKVGVIPADVTGSIVPKTLFGEKYVSLLVPDAPSSDHILAGDTIERTRVSTEVERVLSDLYPLLRTVQPAQINMTLNAIATALEGRGEELGQTLVTFDGYLKKINPEIPALVDDLRKLSTVSDIYSDVLPQVATILDNTVTTTTTLEDRETKLQNLFVDVAGLSDSARTFLADNEDNLVRFGELGAAQLRVLARYSSEFPCLTGGIVNSGDALAEAFRDFTLHIVLETLPRQPRGYNPADRPRIGDNRGPACLTLPNPPWSQSNPVKSVPNFDDGVDEPTGKGTDRVAPGYVMRDGKSYPGSSSEADLYRRLLAPGMGVSPDEVSDLGALLMGPMARGAKVSLR